MLLVTISTHRSQLVIIGNTLPDGSAWFDNSQLGGSTRSCQCGPRCNRGQGANGCHVDARIIHGSGENARTAQNMFRTYAQLHIYNEIMTRKNVIQSYSVESNMIYIYIFAHIRTFVHMSSHNHTYHNPYISIICIYHNITT